MQAWHQRVGIATAIQARIRGKHARQEVEQRRVDVKMTDEARVKMDRKQEQVKAVNEYADLMETSEWVKPLPSEVPPHGNLIEGAR